MMLEQLDIHTQNHHHDHHDHHHHLDTDLTSFTKVNSKWITDLNVKYKSIKLLEDNIRENLDYLGYIDDVLYTTP